MDDRGIWGLLCPAEDEGGSDLNVFIDESDANGWQDGTKVEMVVKMVEVTINGETMDGFLEAQSAKTISGGTTK